jgi:hypothetical protein
MPILGTLFTDAVIATDCSAVTIYHKESPKDKTLSKRHNDQLSECR